MYARDDALLISIWLAAPMFLFFCHLEHGMRVLLLARYHLAVIHTRILEQDTTEITAYCNE